MSSKNVLVTGASGFIALHVVDACLKRGYNVIGTVRSQSKADSISKDFKKEYPDANLTLVIVEDIAAEGAFDEVLKSNPNITDILHTASPFAVGLGSDLKKAYLAPATEGTRNILEAAQKFGGNVKHVVITSSFAAILNFDKICDKLFVHTEETWNPITWDHVQDDMSAYTASKKLAEKLAQDFVVENKPSWTLTTVNPPYVFGPQKFDNALKSSTLNTSAEILNGLLSSDPTDEHFFSDGIAFPASDVRDIATLHVLPIENDSLGGKRLFAGTVSCVSQTMLNILHKEFPELDGKIAKGKPEGTDEFVDSHCFAIDNSATLKATGIKQWISLETSVKDAASQILEYRKKSAK